MITKPMLAGKCENVAALVFPVLATPKLDGIRCIVQNGKALSRKFLAIPNDHIRNSLEDAFTQGKYRASFDGEIMVRGRTFNELSGDVRRHDGKPDFFYAVFDRVCPPTLDCPHLGLSQPYVQRTEALKLLSLPDFCVKILPVLIKNELDLAQYEADQLLLGYEGVMVRSIQSPYKCGRSTFNEGYLLKIKRFEDGEAEVIGYDCEYENQNAAERDAFGRTKRSSCQENLVAKDRLGKLEVRDLKTKVEFDIGTGFTASDREKLWLVKDKLKGLIVKYKHQPSGADAKPRFPVWLAFRDTWDMD